MQITDEDVEEFLSHYGVAGMKWGVRKQRTPEEAAARKARNKKIAKVVVVGGVAIGAAFVAYKMNQKGPVKMTAISDSPGIKDAMNRLKAQSATPKHLQPKPTVKSSGNSRTEKVMAEIIQGVGKKKIAEIQDERAKVSKEVNDTLKTWYNEASTPIPDRTYMEDK